MLLLEWGQFFDVPHKALPGLASTSPVFSSTLLFGFSCADHLSLLHTYHSLSTTQLLNMCTLSPTPFSTCIPVPIPFFRSLWQPLAWSPFDTLLGLTPAPCHDRADLCWQFSQGFIISWLSAGFDQFWQLLSLLQGSMLLLGQAYYVSCLCWVL